MTRTTSVSFCFSGVLSIFRIYSTFPFQLHLWMKCEPSCGHDGFSLYIYIYANQRSVLNGVCVDCRRARQCFGEGRVPPRQFPTVMLMYYVYISLWLGFADDIQEGNNGGTNAFQATTIITIVIE